MKKKIKAKVLSQTKLQNGIYDLKIETVLAKEAHAGQFVGIYTNDKSKLLPRPISICEADDKTLRLVYRVTGAGTGTENISLLKEGDEVYILGILGNGYDVSEILDKYKHPVLMGGGIGIPPMLELSKELHTGSVILGYRDSNTFLDDEFREILGDDNVYIATEDGSVGTQGNVLDVMKDNLQMKMIEKSSDVEGAQMDKDIALCDIILACGPMPMLRAIAKYARDNGIKAYVSLEERMACGVGACLGCITKTKDIDEHSQVKNTRICTDGPVFDTEMLEF
ncbi:MAG: dihydroorotate dehydrogenase electron transfer subunit [Lachnospiraceae bacterium]|nr:dihydroorotate dehydrogenase electron transfer subunit [Lachnospiraceae bacterium]